MTPVLRCRLCERTQPLAPRAACPACDGPLDLIRGGTIAGGERVVLVVTGTGLEPYAVDADVASTDVGGDIESVLAALGV